MAADELLDINVVGTPTPQIAGDAVPTIDSMIATSTPDMLNLQVTDPMQDIGTIPSPIIETSDAIIGTDEDDDIKDESSRKKKIYGRKGKDKIKGSDNGDEIYGGKDDDDCEGGKGKDKIYGDKGKDKCSGGEGDDEISGNEGDDQISGDDGNDTLYGGKDNDTCTGGGGDDSVSGDIGNDSLTGGDGNDSLMGGDGNDIASGDAGNDSLMGGDGNDSCMGGEGNDIVSGDAGDDSLMGGDGNDSLMGGDGNDMASGDAGDDSVSAGAGNDTLMGGDGNDTCMGDAGDDSISGGAGNDSLMGGDGNDMASGDAGDDSISAGAGNDTLMGGDGNDVCDGGIGDDSISAGAGNDTLMGGDGNDVCDAGDGDDSIMGGSGDDSLSGGAGNDAIEAGEGNNTLEGGAGDDSIMGGVGDNSLSGGEGDDTIIGGEGNHTCTGGAGNDSFIMKDATSGGKSVISDYTDSSDKFLLAGGLSFSSLSFIQVGFNTEIRSSSNFVLAVLLNISATIIEAGDFLQINDDNTTSTVTPTNSPSPSPTTPLITTPTLEANKELTVTAGGEQTITIDSLRFFDGDDPISSIVYKITNLPDATVGQIFYKGEAVTAVGFTFTQLDISLKLVTFKAADGFKGDVNFGFEVTDGKTVVGGQSFKFKVVTNIFDFSGKTQPQVITGSPSDDSIQAGDGGDDIKAGEGNDKIKGGKGNDKIDGGDGDDEIEGGEGKNTLTGGKGKNRFIYKKAREGVIKIEDADLITDFKSDQDSLEFSTAAFGNIVIGKFKKLNINVNLLTIDDDSNLLDFSDDDSVFDIESLQKRFKAFGRKDNRGRFCQFTDRATGRSVLVFSQGIRFEIIAVFSFKITLDINNFFFTGPALPTATGTEGPDFADFASSTESVTYDGLGGDDTIFGSKFDDDFIGGDGDDAISGSEGKDLLKGGSGADIFSYTNTKEGGDKIVDFTSGVDKFRFVSTEFGNLNGSNFDLVNIAGSTTDITDKELLIFSGTYASLGDVQKEFSALPGAGTSPVFCFFQNAAGESVLVFDVDGTGSAPTVEIANLGTGVTSLGSADFLFGGTVTPPPPVMTNANSVVDLTDAGNTYPSAVNDFSTSVGGYGFSGPVLFMGDGKANSVTGTEFADIFTGGGGADFLTGGSGADIFSYKAPLDGGDTITDFVAGVDKFEFVAATFGNMTSTNFDAVSGSTPDITDKELVIFTDGTYASFEDAQAKATGASTTPGFFAFSNAANETVLVFDSNGTTTGGFTTVATLGSSPVTLGAGDFVFTGTIAPKAPAASAPALVNSTVDLTTAGNTYPSAANDFGSGVGGYGFTGPVTFMGDGSNNSVIGTDFNDSLSGGGGNDTLTGGGGDDTLTGGLGVDSLDGGAGNDVFVFSGTDAAGSDFITNFSTADDLIRLDSVGFGGFETGPLGSSFYVYDNTGSTVDQIEATLTSSPAIMALYDSGAGVSTLYYDSNGSTVGGNSLFATLNNVDFGAANSSKLFLF